MEATLWEQAERYLGTAIEPSERDSAKASAEQKLKRIISREGSAGGARHEPWYLAQLIAEAVKASRLTKFTLDLCGLLKYANDMGAEKERPVS